MMLEGFGLVRMIALKKHIKLCFLLQNTWCYKNQNSGNNQQAQVQCKEIFNFVAGVRSVILAV